jgi:hypothetical protein
MTTTSEWRLEKCECVFATLLAAAAFVESKRMSELLAREALMHTQLSSLYLIRQTLSQFLLLHVNDDGGGDHSRGLIFT